MLNGLMPLRWTQLFMAHHELAYLGMRKGDQMLADENLSKMKQVLDAGILLSEYC